MINLIYLQILQQYTNFINHSETQQIAISQLVHDLAHQCSPVLDELDDFDVIIMHNDHDDPHDPFIQVMAQCTVLQIRQSKVQMD